MALAVARPCVDQTIDQELKMAISSETIALIQTAGKSIHDLDAAIKLAVTSYGDEVRRNMVANPFDVQNDSLYEEWKTISRVSQTIEKMEGELRNVLQVIKQIGGNVLIGNIQTPQIAATVMQAGTAVTDVVPKRAKRSAVSLKKSIKQELPATTKVPKAKGKGLSSNMQTLLNHLQGVLTTTAFTDIKRVEECVKAGLPKGSATAAFKSLLDKGYLRENTTGQLKLISKK